MNQVQEEAGLMITVDHEGSLNDKVNGDDSDNLPLKLEATPSKRPRGRPRKNQTIAKPVSNDFFFVFMKIYSSLFFMNWYYKVLFILRFICINAD